MTEVISLRIAPEKLAQLDRRSADSGLDRSKYLLRLLEDDLARPQPKEQRKFASSHLLGKFRASGSSNAQVQAAMKARHEKNR